MLILKNIDWKIKNTYFFSPDLNSIFLLLSSWRKILKLVKLLKDLLINGKQRWLLLFISLWSLNAAFVQIDCTFMSFQLFILFRSITAKMPNNFLFNIYVFTPLNFFPKTKIWLVSFVTDAGKRIPRGVIL